MSSLDVLNLGDTLLADSIISLLALGVREVGEAAELAAAGAFTLNHLIGLGHAGAVGLGGGR